MEIKYEDLDDIDGDESGSDVDAVRRLRPLLVSTLKSPRVVILQDALFQLEESPLLEDAAHRFA